MEAPTTADHRAADRHHRFLLRKVHEGIFATQSAAVAAALEQMIQDEAEREVALAALAEEIRARIHTPRSEFVVQEQAYSTSRATNGAARGVTYRPRFHPLVERDLDTVAQWIIDYAVAEVAHRKLMEIERTFTDLAHLPHKGSVRDDLGTWVAGDSCRAESRHRIRGRRYGRGDLHSGGYLWPCRLGGPQPLPSR